MIYVDMSAPGGSYSCMVVQMIHLGTHRLTHQFPEPALLMEVMPSVLARRSFPPPTTLACLEPGFRESPDPCFPMALVFLKVRHC